MKIFNMVVSLLSYVEYRINVFFVILSKNITDDVPTLNTITLILKTAKITRNGSSRLSSLRDVKNLNKMFSH